MQTFAVSGASIQRSKKPVLKSPESSLQSASRIKSPYFLLVRTKVCWVVLATMWHSNALSFTIALPLLPTTDQPLKSLPLKIGFHGSLFDFSWEKDDGTIQINNRIAKIKCLYFTLFSIGGYSLLLKFYNCFETNSIPFFLPRLREYFRSFTLFQCS